MFIIDEVVIVFNSLSPTMLKWMVFAVGRIHLGIMMCPFWVWSLRVCDEWNKKDTHDDVFWNKVQSVGVMMMMSDEEGDKRKRVKNGCYMRHVDRTKTDTIHILVWLFRQFNAYRCYANAKERTFQSLFLKHIYY